MIDVQRLRNFCARDLGESTAGEMIALLSVQCFNVQWWAS